MDVNTTSIQRRTTPTIGETVRTHWGSLPLLFRALVPTIIALTIVLLPATLIITDRFYDVTTDTLSSQHAALLAEIGTRIDEMLAVQSTYVTGVAARDEIIVCAATGCVEAAEAVFKPELLERSPGGGGYVIEVGFIALNGQQTARAVRGSGGVILTSNPAFTVNQVNLNLMQSLGPGQAHVFPLMRDARIPSDEAYQQPVLRLAAPVISGGAIMGYVMVVVNLDDFFTQLFVPRHNVRTFLVNDRRCLIASDDVSERAAIYRVWIGAPNPTCLADLPVQDWETTTQPYGTSIVSARPILGPLALSDQLWTVVVQAPTAVAYAQVYSMQTLLIGINSLVVVMVVVLMVLMNRAAEKWWGSEEPEQGTAEAA